MKMTLRLGCLSLISFALIGCGTLSRTEMSSCGGMTACGWISPQGRNVSDNKDLGDIETGYLDADMNYYYSGCDTLPAAVIKLNKEYTLDDIRWLPITDRKLLLKLLQYMKTTIMEDSGRELRGFTIKAHNGRPIGVWYTNKYAYGIRFGRSADNRLYVYAPTFVNANIFAKIFPEKMNSNEVFAKVTPPPGMLNQKVSIACLRCHNQETLPFS